MCHKSHKEEIKVRTKVVKIRVQMYKLEMCLGKLNSSGIRGNDKCRRNNYFTSSSSRELNTSLFLLLAK